MQIVLTEAGGYVDDAAAALQSSAVYVSPEVGGAAGLADAIQAQIGDASIGVAVFSDNASLEASGPEIVAELGQPHGYDTIIVAVGDDLSAGSQCWPRDEAMTIANEAESEPSLEAALTETVQGVVAASDSPPPATADGSGGVVIGLAIGAAVVVGAVVGIFALVRRRRRPPLAEAPVPEGIRAQVQTLQALSVDYAAVGVTGHPLAGQTAQDIQVIADNVTELFERLGRKGLRIPAPTRRDRVRRQARQADRGGRPQVPPRHPHPPPAVGRSGRAHQRGAGRRRRRVGAARREHQAGQRAARTPLPGLARLAHRAAQRAAGLGEGVQSGDRRPGTAARVGDRSRRWGSAD